MNNKYPNIHVYVGVFSCISLIHQTWSLQCMPVNYSIGTTDTLITHCRAYKYYLTMLALCPGALGFTKSIGTQHKNTKPFLGHPISNTHFMCILTLASHASCICNVLGVSSLRALQSREMPVSFGETSILAKCSSMSKPILARALFPWSEGSKSN